MNRYLLISLLSIWALTVLGSEPSSPQVSLGDGIGLGSPEGRLSKKVNFRFNQEELERLKSALKDVESAKAYCGRWKDQVYPFDVDLYGDEKDLTKSWGSYIAEGLKEFRGIFNTKYEAARTVAELVQEERTKITKVLEVLLDQYKIDEKCFDDVKVWIEKFHSVGALSETKRIADQLVFIIEYRQQDKVLELAELILKEPADQLIFFRKLLDKCIRSGDERHINFLKAWLAKHEINIDDLDAPEVAAINNQLVRAFEGVGLEKASAIAELIQEGRSDKTALLKTLIAAFRYDIPLFGPLKAWFKSHPCDVDGLGDKHTKIIKETLDSFFREHGEKGACAFELARLFQKERADKTAVLRTLFHEWSMGCYVFDDLCKWYTHDPVDIDATRIGQQLSYELMLSDEFRKLREQAFEFAKLVQKKRHDTTAVLRALLNRYADILRIRDVSAKSLQISRAAIKEWADLHPCYVDTAQYDETQTIGAKIDSFCDNKLREIFSKMRGNVPLAVIPAPEIDRDDDLGSERDEESSSGEQEGLEGTQDGSPLGQQHLDGTQEQGDPSNPVTTGSAVPNSLQTAHAKNAQWLTPQKIALMVAVGAGIVYYMARSSKSRTDLSSKNRPAAA